MNVLIALVNGLKVLVIADAVFSWVVPPDVFPRSVTKALLDPVYGPVRSLLAPITGSIDLSPLIALGLLYALEKALKPEPGR